jgi:two-component system sensor histidine kinase/response regulator
VDGLDTRDGLSRVAGNKKLYLKLLRQFVDEQRQAPDRIAEALARNEAPVAERLAHTVKGVAGSLGSRSVQQAGATLERAIAARVPSTELTPALEQFSLVLEDFIGRLSAALPTLPTAPAPPTVAAALDPEKAKQVLQEMTGHLSNFDPAASDCLEANRGIFQALLGNEGLAGFEQEVGGFAFAEALARLQGSAKEKGVLPS